MNPPEIRENMITSYRLAEKSIVGEFAESVGNYDLLSLVMICLNDTGKHEENYAGILRMLDVLLSETFN